MLKKLLATTALVAMMAGSAVAQTATPAPAETTAPVPVAKSDGHLASNIIGEGVFNSSAADAQDVGKVTDVVLDKDGKAVSLIIGVGGFLGVGQKNVEVPYADATWAEKDGDRWLVVAMTKEQLEAAAAFDTTPYMPPVPAPVATTPATTPPADATTPPATTTTPTEPKATDPAAPAAPAPAQ